MIVYKAMMYCLFSRNYFYVLSVRLQSQSDKLFPNLPATLTREGVTVREKFFQRSSRGHLAGVRIF